jgi:hypothetical protein
VNAGGDFCKLWQNKNLFSFNFELRLRSCVAHAPLPA